MTRSEFEKEFFNISNAEFRRASIINALAAGPNWAEWGKKGRKQDTPNYYNDLAFLACYMVFRNDTSMTKCLQVRDFLVARSASDSGYMIDPANKDSPARKLANSNNSTFIGTYVLSKYTESAVTNIYSQVYSEMWTPNGSMRAYLGFGWDKSFVFQNLRKNLALVLKDKQAGGKLAWFDSLVTRFEGKSDMSGSKFPKTYDCRTIGLYLDVPTLLGSRSASTKLRSGNVIF